MPYGHIGVRRPFGGTDPLTGRRVKSGFEKQLERARQQANECAKTTRQAQTIVWAKPQNPVDSGCGQGTAKFRIVAGALARDETLAQVYPNAGDQTHDLGSWGFEVVQPRS